MSVAPDHEHKLLLAQLAPVNIFTQHAISTSVQDGAVRAALHFSRLIHTTKVAPVTPNKHANPSVCQIQRNGSQPSRATDPPLNLSFQQAFGPLGIPLLFVVVVCIAWTSWLIFLTVAPNEAANLLMNTGEYDNGNFWLIVERGPAIKWASVLGLLLVTTCYFLALVKMLRFRHVIAGVGKSTGENPFIRAWSAVFAWCLVQCTPGAQHKMQRLQRSYSNLTGFNAVNRKYFNTFQKTCDWIFQGLVLHRSLNQGLPDTLVYGYASLLAINGLSVSWNIVTRRYSAFAEVVIDSGFDFAAAVLYPIVVLLYCYYNFSFDRQVYLINAEILPPGNFERYARMLADPAEVALFLINFNSLRISGTLDFALGIGMNLCFCYRFVRVITVVITQRCHVESLGFLSPLKPRNPTQRQKHVPRWVALVFLAASTAVMVFTYTSISRSFKVCAAYPECVACAHVWNPGEQCPCIMMVDGDRAPRSANEWNFPEDVTEKVRALAASGMLNGLQLVNRQLRHWPDEMRRCTNLLTISLLYTSTEEIPSWASEFKHLQHLHIEGKHGSRNLVTLPLDLFSDLPEFTFLHLGNHHNLVALPAFSGTPNLRSLTLAVLLSLTELPLFDNLPSLEIMTLVHIQRVSAVPDMASLASLSRFVVFRPNHLCCNGFIGSCDLTDSFCAYEPVFDVPSASCLTSNDVRRATPATRELFTMFAPAVCQKSPIPFALEALSDFPSPERIAVCDGVMYRQCDIPGVTSVNGTIGMCYSSRMQVVACNVDQFFIEVRRVQIERGVGSLCDPQEEAWLGCKQQMDI